MRASSLPHETQTRCYIVRNIFLISFVMLAAVFNYARVKYPVSVPSNPLAVLRFGKHMRRIEAREDRLEGDDFRAFYVGIQAFNEILLDCYLVCLYQGMRSEETAGLRWEHVDLEKRVIFIPDTNEADQKN
ncbi:hypothetical protein Ppro_0456 [Pelobacter propionicus DSM 2379]|uniref:Tyr recombinase domain-containing protein n=1 Tax=Pelobacter propionicus (strain DSM 2379 / NBRC 103807 / OttBd1) TaxID=338966 RepID=A1AL68_PELPD|nr:hypothetical protein Ppro_0456 [Pelobacter propionicus DSM 2379]